MKNLSHRAYPRTPMVWGSPPSGSGLDDAGGSIISPPVAGQEALSLTGGADLSAALTPVAFGINYNNGSITTAFPQAIRVATQGFLTTVGIVSVDLITGIFNASSDAPVAVFICRDTGPTLNFLQNTGLYIGVICPANTSDARRTCLAFADDVAPKVSSNEKLAMYISSSGTGGAGNMISAVANVRYFSV